MRGICHHHCRGSALSRSSGQRQRGGGDLAGGHWKVAVNTFEEPPALTSPALHGLTNCGGLHQATWACLPTGLAAVARRAPRRRVHLRSRCAARAAAQKVRLAVPEEVLQQLPASVQEEGELRDAYLQRALAIGVGAIAQASVSLDASVVRSEFEGFFDRVRQHEEETQRSLQQLVDGQLTGEDSRLARLLLEQLGEGGRLALLLEDAHRQLADPKVKSSLPNAVVGLVAEALHQERSRLSGLVDVTDPSSPLARFLRGQKEDLQSLQTEYVQRATVLEERLNQAVSEIRSVLHVNGLTRQREELFDKSVAKGITFEDAGYEALVQMAQGFGDRIEPCGTVVVDGTTRKVGDQLIHVSQPGIPEFRIVVEQKAGKVGRKPLLKRMREAVELRSASGAIGLMLRKYLGRRQPPYEEHGPAQIIVAVDWRSGDEEETDWFPLQVAYRVLRGQLVAAALKKKGLEVNIENIRVNIANIRSQLDETQRIKRSATQARSSLDAITNSVSSMADSIRRQLTAMEQGLQSPGAADAPPAEPS